MSEEAAVPEVEPTNFVDEFFADGAEPEPAGGGLAEDFLKDVLSDEPETPETPEKPEGEEPEAEAPETPEKPEGEEDDAPEEPPKGSSKKASEDWKKLRASRDKHKEEAAKVSAAVQEKEAKLAELQTKVTELEELRGKAAISADLEEKLKNYEEMEKTVALLRVEESPEYKRAIAEPLSVLETQVEALGTENSGDMNEIFAALNEMDPVKQRVKLKEVTAGWDEIDKVELRTLAADARVLLNKQREMRENASVAAKQRDEMSKAEAAKAAVEAKKAFQTASESVVGQLKDKIPFVPLREGETPEDRFAALAEKLKGVDFDSNSVNDKAFAAASALALPSAIKTIAKLQAEVKALEDRLGKANSSKPGKSDPVDDGGAEEEQDFFEAVGVKTFNASQRLKVSL